MNRKRLLVVDDEPELGEYVGLVAGAMGYEVEITASAAEFKRVYDSFDPTMIVMDIVMPETNGVELVGWLIKRESTARILVASGMTSVYGSSLEKLGADAGMSISFLAKPYRLESLRDALREGDEPSV